MTSPSLDRAAIVAAARAWIGTPYHHQASLPGVGCDCLGLIRGVFRDLVGPEPEAAPAYGPGWAESDGEERLLEAAGRHLVPIDQDAAAAGDVVLFRWRPHVPAKHCGILTGPLREAGTGMVHAQDGAAVAEVKLGPWWLRRVAGSFAFPGTGP